MGWRDNDGLTGTWGGASDESQSHTAGARGIQADGQDHPQMAVIAHTPPV